MQVKLLRAIQEKSVRAVGASQEVPVDVRILSATHKDLGELASDGRFRHDLYYRSNVIELRVPPLRERTGDLPPVSYTHLDVYKRQAVGIAVLAAVAMSLEFLVGVFGFSSSERPVACLLYTSRCV